MRKAALVLIAALVVAGVAFAGGQSEQKAVAPAKPITSLPWSDIVAQAKKEGKVVWYQWYFQPEFRTFTKAFTDKYGIQVVIPDGTLQANTDKFLAERSRAAGDIDALSFGGDYTNNLDVQNTLLGPITSVIPDGSKLKTAIQGGDSHGYAVVFWGNQVGIAYNPAHVNESQLPQTVAELGAWMKANPNRFGFNVSNGGSGPAFIQSIARNLVPGDYSTDG
ncbi:MAG TPA: extracellular solute-binding protein, partial [Spirochaetia bacterium]|nr:extracellular solute-binding protein [Spirochaetia bacterium]